MVPTLAPDPPCFDGHCSSAFSWGSHPLRDEHRIHHQYSFSGQTTPNPVGTHHLSSQGKSANDSILVAPCRRNPSKAATIGIRSSLGHSTPPYSTASGFRRGFSRALVRDPQAVTTRSSCGYSLPAIVNAHNKSRSLMAGHNYSVPVLGGVSNSERRPLVADDSGTAGASLHANDRSSINLRLRGASLHSDGCLGINPRSRDAFLHDDHSSDNPRSSAGPKLVPLFVSYRK